MPEKRDVALGHAEGAVLQVQVAVEVRIDAGAGDRDVGLERAGDVGQLAREALDDPEIHARRLDAQVDRVARGGRRVPGSRRGFARSALSGKLPFAVSSTPGVCTSRASRPMRPLANVASATSDSYLNCWKPPLRHGDVPRHRRRLGAAGDLRVGVEPCP